MRCMAVQHRWFPEKLSIKLNQNFGNLKFKPIKKAERDSLYVALDLAEYWLKEAMEMDPWI